MALHAPTTPTETYATAVRGAPLWFSKRRRGTGFRAIGGWLAAGEGSGGGSNLCGVGPIGEDFRCGLDFVLRFDLTAQRSVR